VSAILVFALCSLVALGTVAVVLHVLRPRLTRLLIELTGSEARAGFWVTVSTWWVGIVGVLAGTATFGYSLGRDLSGSDLLAAVLIQLRTFLAGLLGAILVLSLFLLRWPRRGEETPDQRSPRSEAPSPPRLGTRPPAPPGAWPVS
jgi:hypothetical protein